MDHILSAQEVPGSTKRWNYSSDFGVREAARFIAGDQKTKRGGD